MLGTLNQGSWANSIATGVAEREVRRQLSFNRTRKFVQARLLALRSASKDTALFAEFLKMLAGSMLAFFTIGWALGRFLHVRPLLLFPVLGFIYSAQATYHKYRLSANPNYRIPKCKCAGRRNDGTESVLRSSHSEWLGVPNSFFAAVIYLGLLLAVFFQQGNAINALVTVLVVASTYLSYVMIRRVSALCGTCINLSALNVLILLQLLR
jgi:uncharacterized membrane protein